jgi:hypothetical protein
VLLTSHVALMPGNRKEGNHESSCTTFVSTSLMAPNNPTTKGPLYNSDTG